MNNVITMIPIRAGANADAHAAAEYQRTVRKIMILEGAVENLANVCKNEPVEGVLADALLAADIAVGEIRAALNRARAELGLV